jgi:hypothetical protein
VVFDRYYDEDIDGRDLDLLVTLGKRGFGGDVLGEWRFDAACYMQLGDRLIWGAVIEGCGNAYFLVWNSHRYWKDLYIGIGMLHSFPLCCLGTAPHLNPDIGRWKCAWLYSWLD